MADFRAIAAVGSTLVGLIESAYGTYFPDQAITARFRLIQGRDVQPGQDPVENGRGVTVYLYRVAPNPSRRNLPVRIEAQGRRILPPTALDLFYLITAWWEGTDTGSTSEPSREQQWLLALALRALEDNPILPAGLLNHYANASVFREDESVELIGEVLPLSDLVAIWEVNKSRMQPSGTFMARSVQIDSTLDATVEPAVQIRDFDLARPGDGP